MQIDKEEIIALLRERGDDAKAGQARRSCLDRSTPNGTPPVKLSIDPSDLLGGLGGLGGKLGL